MLDDTPMLTVPMFPGVWSHPRLARWAVWLRVLGYRGRLPAWAVQRCWGWFPHRVCACGMYRIVWTDKEVLCGEDEEPAED
jgi:hypothetical protein